jgi:LysM repeat protein
MVVDRDGTVAVSTNLNSWQRVGTVPGVNATNRVQQVGLTSQGNYAVLMANGTAFESNDASAWNPLAVPTTQVSQDVVIRHTVRSGDTVWAIARNNGVTVTAVVNENSLPQGGALIRVGQVLNITKRSVVTTVASPVILDPSVDISAGANRPVDPAGPDQQPPAQEQDSDGSEESPAADQPEVAPLPPLEPVVTQTVTTDVFYSVARGDTLIRIAARNRTTVARLVADNGIKNPSRIFVGQRLKVGENSLTMTYHRSQEGDTLERISERRSVPLATVVRLNPSVPGGQAITAGTLIRIS